MKVLVEDVPDEQGRGRTISEWFEGVVEGEQGELMLKEWRRKKFWEVFECVVDGVQGELCGGVRKGWEGQTPGWRRE